MTAATTSAAGVPAAPAPATPWLEAFDVHGVRMTLTVPGDPGEAAAAAEVVRRLATETAPRWERVPGTLGGTALRARVLDEAGAALDGLGLVHWALSSDGDVLASGSPRPRRQPPLEALELHDPAALGKPWRSAVVDGAAVADVALAGIPGWHAALAVRHRGEDERRRLVAVLASSATAANSLAERLVAGDPAAPGPLEDRLDADGAAALIVAAGRDPLVSPRWPLAGAAWAPQGAPAP